MIYKFWGCSSLTSVTIPNSVTSLGYYAFRGCSGLTYVTIPSSVTSIESGAFSGCNGLTSVTIPSSVTNIGESAFSGCSGLNSIKVEYGNTVYDSRNDCNAIIMTEMNELISGCKKTLIPGNVTSIGQSAFLGCTGLTSITIPGSVAILGQAAFYGCSGLTSVKIPDSVIILGKSAFGECTSLSSVKISNSVMSIGESAFLRCSALTSIAIPNSVTSIEISAFEGCTSLSSVTIPNSVTIIGHSAFEGCTNLSSVTIPNSVTSLGQQAFWNCSGLTSITIGNGVANIGWKTFGNCKRLTSVTIPNSVMNIDTYAFASCNDLTSITIGSGVKKIGYEAFAFCSKIMNVTCLVGNVPSTDSNAFDYSHIDNATLHVPKYSLNGYKATAPWSSFKNIVSLPDNFYYTLTYMVDGEVYKTYTLTAGSTITPEPEPTKEGYTFSGWSTIPKTMPEHDVTVYGTFVKNTIYTPGDVNDDGSVSVTDVGCAINYILEQVPSPFVFEAADMNGDNSVSVTDVGMIINIILSDGASRLERNSLERNGNNENIVSPSLSLMPVNEGYELQLENKDAYIGFQFDVELAEGATISDMRLASADDNDHVLTYRQLDNGKWRVVCNSPSNSTFVADDTSLLTITVVGNASERYFTGNAGIATLGSVAHFSNIRLTTAEFDELRPISIEGLPTGIASIEQGMKMSVENRTLNITSDRNAVLRLYSLDGCVRKTLQVKKGVNSFDGLRAGIYMINNQKVILR